MKNRQSFLDRMRFLNKKIFNRVTLKFAGAVHSPISTICHVGRRSGTRYTTPVLALPYGEKFIFALPYGTKVDWYRNVQAAGKGILVWHGKEYLVKNPESLVARTASSSGLPFALRVILLIVGAQLFRQMKSTRVIVESHPDDKKGLGEKDSTDFS